MVWKEAKDWIFSKRKGAGGIFGPGGASLMGNSFEEQVSKGYEANGWVMRCIRKRVESVSSVPIRLYADRTKKREIESHGLLDLLETPNEEDNWMDFVEDFAGFRLLNGNSYLCCPETTFEPNMMWNLNPGGTRVDVKQGTLLGYEYYSDKGRARYLPQEVLHWMCWNPRTRYEGLSPLKSAALAVAMNNGAKLWNASLLQNMGKPWGAFSTDETLTKDQFDRFEEMIKSRHEGATNAGKALVLEGGLHWESMGLTSQELDWLEGMKFSMREICAIYSVPPQLLGDTESSTYSNYSEAMKSFWRETVVPDLSGMQNALNKFLVPRFDKKRKLFLAFDLTNVEALQEDKAAHWQRVMNADWLTVNEKRKETGFDTKPGWDVILLNMSVMPAPIGEAPPSDDEIVQQPTAEDAQQDDGQAAGDA